MVQHIIRADILLIARIFPRPCGARKKLRNTQNIRTYYMLNHRIRCIYKKKFPKFSVFFREITYCWRLFRGSKVVIIGILRVLASSANKEPGRNLYICLNYNVSFFRNSKFEVMWCFTGQRNNFFKKMHQIKNFGQANFYLIQ